MPAGAKFCPACGTAVARLSPGQILDGKYEILDKIGEGGMGEVYRARHVHLDEIRIIKVTKPGGAAGEPRRFQGEARMATLVRHPNVAALYDFSRLDDGSYYMVWEFIDGITLEHWLRKNGPLPLSRALDVAAQVLGGLAEIHAQGIVHRDLSPDNILLRETSSGRLQAKIIDLGIAKRVAEESLQMTGTGLFLGKLKYCSPEQAGALPPGQALDGRSDLYSFGVVLYEMLSGKAPFESATPEGYIGKHLHTEAPPLDTVKLPRSTGPALAAAVAKSLEKKRDRRYRDAGEFADALARIRAVVPEAPASETSRPSAEERPTNRTRTAIAIALGFGAALGAVSVWMNRKPEVRRRTAAASSRPTQRTVVPAAAPAAPTAPSVETTGEAAPPAVATALPAAPPPPPEATAVPPAAGDAETSAEEARTALARWKSRPGDIRARRAVEIARLADRFVASHPDTPFAAELRDGLPNYLHAQATEALDAARPLDAVLYFRAYRQLSFAPPDPELARRIERAR